MQFLSDNWQIVVAAIGGLGWLFRLEGQAKANAIAIKRLWAQRHEDMTTHKNYREDTKETLGKIDGKIDRLIERLIR